MVIIFMMKEIWSIKYRPSTLDDFVFQNSKQEELVRQFIQNKSIPHLLLTGHAGTGKTSLALMLKKLLDISDDDFLQLNASDENSVDTVRTKIKGFVSSFAMSAFKIVFLDEADYMSPNAQAALRNMMEECADNARFILTCNKPHKIENFIKSRCQTFQFKSLDKDVILEKCAVILKKEKVKVPSLELLENYVNSSYPDFRKILNTLQQNTVNSVLHEPNEFDESTEIFLKIAEHLQKNNFSGIREFISNNLSDDDWEALYRFLYDYLNEIGKFTDVLKWKQGIIVIADHLYKHQFVADPEINAAAMFIRLGEI